MSQQTNEQINVTPTREDMIVWLTDQIAFRKLQVELQSLETEMAELKFREISAINGIATASPKSESLQKHTVTKEDLDNNPDLVSQGIRVGDVVGISVE